MGTESENIDPKNWWRYEWLELYNNTNLPTPLDGWELQFYRENLDWSIKLKGIIQPNSYFLIVSSEKISPSYDLNYSNLSGKLNNKGQKLTLKDNLGNLIDNFDCFSQGKWFAGNNATKQTMERINTLTEASNPSDWTTSKDPGGTPKAKNSFYESWTPSPSPSPTPKEELPSPTLIINPTPSPKTEEISYPGNIFLNEILPSPSGSDEKEEWIELSNENNFEVDLSGWKIEDSKGKTTVYDFPQATKIPAQGFLVLSRPITKIVLNNDGDEVKLFSPNGILSNSVIYTNAPRGQSFAKADGEWFWNDSPTPGSKNIIAQEKLNVNTEDNSQEKVNQGAETSLAEEGSAQIGKKIPKPISIIPSVALALPIAFFSGIIIVILRQKLRKAGLNE